MWAVKSIAGIVISVIDFGYFLMVLAWLGGILHFYNTNGIEAFNLVTIIGGAVSILASFVAYSFIAVFFLACAVSIKANMRYLEN